MTEKTGISRAEKISVVIPLKDEAETLEELYAQIRSVLEGSGRSFEVIFVDDGSTDGSMEIIEKLHRADGRVLAIEFERNYGKAAAWSAGFAQATGGIVITMDADLQDDPKEIPRFIEEIEAGYDLVSGWKKKRFDPLSKTLPSKLFNKVTALATGVQLHDFSCGFKAFRKEVLERMEIHGDLHRFIAALASWKGFRIGEIVVEHHPRKHGKSKYGWERLPRGFFDLITVLLTVKYGMRPVHALGWLGTIFGAAGFAVTFYNLAKGLYVVFPAGLLLFMLAAAPFLVGIKFVKLAVIEEQIAKARQRGETLYEIRRRLE